MADTIKNISTEYDLVDTIQDIGRDYFGDELSTQRIGTFGMIAESLAHGFGAAILDASIRSAEYTLSTAKLRTTILTEAPDNLFFDNAVPAKLNAYFGIAVQDIFKHGVRVSNDVRNTDDDYILVIEKDSIYNIDEYSFMLEHDIQIYATLTETGSYSYIVKYLLPGDIDESSDPVYTYPYYHSLDEIHVPYLTSFVGNDEEGNSLLTFEATLREMSKSIKYHTVVENDAVSLTGVDFSYEGQLSHFNIYYKENSSMTNWTYMTGVHVSKKYLMGTVDDTIFYEIFHDEGVLRLDIINFTPKYNSEFMVEIFTTNGVRVNGLVYDGDGTESSTELISPDDRHSYTNLNIACRPVGETSEGSDIPTIDVLRTKVIAYKSTLNSINTEHDMEIFMKNDDDYNNYIFIKRRNDILERLYGIYTIIRREDESIVGTTTYKISGSELIAAGSVVSLTPESGSDSSIDIVPVKSVNKYEEIEFANPNLLISRNVSADYLYTIKYDLSVDVKIRKNSKRHIRHINSIVQGLITFDEENVDNFYENQKIVFAKSTGINHTATIMTVDRDKNGITVDKYDFAETGWTVRPQIGYGENYSELYDENFALDDANNSGIRCDTYVAVLKLINENGIIYNGPDKTVTEAYLLMNHVGTEFLKSENNYYDIYTYHFSTTFNVDNALTINGVDCLRGKALSFSQMPETYDPSNDETPIKHVPVLRTVLIPTTYVTETKSFVEAMITYIPTWTIADSYEVVNSNANWQTYFTDTDRDKIQMIDVRHGVDFSKVNSVKNENYEIQIAIEKTGVLADGTATYKGNLFSKYKNIFISAPPVNASVKIEVTGETVASIVSKLDGESFNYLDTSIERSFVTPYTIYKHSDIVSVYNPSVLSNVKLTESYAVSSPTLACVASSLNITRNPLLTGIEGTEYHIKLSCLVSGDGSGIINGEDNNSGTRKNALMAVIAFENVGNITRDDDSLSIGCRILRCTGVVNGIYTFEETIYADSQYIFDNNYIPIDGLQTPDLRDNSAVLWVNGLTRLPKDDLVCRIYFYYIDDNSAEDSSFEITPDFDMSKYSDPLLYRDINYDRLDGTYLNNLDYPIAVLPGVVDENGIPDPKYPLLYGNLCNVYTVVDKITIYSDITDIVRLYAKNNAETDENDATITNYTSVPLIENVELSTPKKSGYLITNIDNSIKIIRQLNNYVDMNTDFDYKFVKTAGPSALFELEGKDLSRNGVLIPIEMDSDGNVKPIPLDDLNLVMEVEIDRRKIMNMSENDLINAIKRSIKLNIEAFEYAATETNYSVFLSNITTSIETEFDENIRYIDITSINGVSNVRVIKYTGTANAANYVPEFLRVEPENILVTIIT